jgi:hypothetical protein
MAFFTWVGFATAQPTGTIAGVVHDPSGAAVSAAQIKVLSTATGGTRTIATPAQGSYSFSGLQAGDYEVSVEAPGFQRTVRQAVVEAGATTTTDFALRVGDLTESVTVEGATAQMHYDSQALANVVTQGQIEGLPLNGRSFLELAKLEPGVQPPTRTANNRTLVPVLGAPGSNAGGTRFTVDGGSVTSVGAGGSQMGFSQEVVQEFQASSVNLDLSTGIADAGAINVVTRSGDNHFHGAAFYYLRDHNLAAYPGLNRDSADPKPFFQRRQFGFSLGGPIRSNRIFFLGNWERNEQRGVVDTNLAASDFACLSRVTPSPLFGDLGSMRFDGHISDAHTVFVRYSHDGSRAVGPITIGLTDVGPTNGYPSTWSRQSAWADQSILGVTSVLRPTLVNELRFSYFFISSGIVPAREQDCLGCLGIGAPGIAIGQAGLYLGSSYVALNLGRRFEFNDSMTWVHGRHRARFGVDWEHDRGGSLTWYNDPVTISLFSPDQVRASNANIPLPSDFRTLNDILQLPLQSFTFGIGDPRVPQENGGLVRTWNNEWLYFQDTWRLRERLTLNYGIGWSVDGNLNYDRRKPALLEPILGAGGLGPTRKQWKNFSPMLGLAWAPSRDGKTVVRAGAGLYYAPLNYFAPDAERAALGPPGLGRQNFSGTSILNPLPGIPGVPVGRSLNFPGTPTLFTGAELMAILPAIQASTAQSLANADPTVQVIQITKQFAGASVNGLVPSDFPSGSALHASLGVQRQIAHDFVLSADIVYRHFIHTEVGLDLNHYNTTRQVLPTCTSAQQNDPSALCSNGPINVQEAPGRATYKGLLLRAEKRISRGFQVLASYAYSSETGTSFRNGFNLDNWLQNTGPIDFSDFTQIANLAGVVRLPWQFDLGLNFSYSSAPPFSAYVGGIDFNGDGTTGDLLPGTTVNAFNRGMGRSDLERLVAEFNTTYAGTNDSHGRSIPHLTLPARYSFGDNVHSLDLRLSRSFVLREHWRLSLIGEVFNLYNKANLSNYSGDLTSAAFGQPTSRAKQVFGSGGPRAFQLAMRVGF